MRKKISIKVLFSLLLISTIVILSVGACMAEESTELENNESIVSGEDSAAEEKVAEIENVYEVLEMEYPASEEFRAVWVATVLNLEFPTQVNLTNDEIKKEIISILDGSQTMDLNAVILQVRPSGDAFYNSEIFPSSYYLTGEQGKELEDDFDVLQFWIDEGKSRGIEIHAWVNPLRLSMGASYPHSTIETLADGNPGKENPEWVVNHTDGKMYLNPGIPEVRDLIIEGIEEIVENYDVAGIHFDDYFYPGQSFDDQEEYLSDTRGFVYIENWRRDNINKIVEGSYHAIKAIDEDVEFGISPFAIWKNQSSDPLGSATMGAQAFYDHYADTYLWVKEGWVDYIAPQIYWHIGFEIADYEELLFWWNDVVKDADVALYTGMAPYRISSSSTTEQWQNSDEIIRQLEMNRDADEVEGFIFFRYESIESNKELQSQLYTHLNNIDVYRDFQGGFKLPEATRELNFARPSSDGAKTTLSEYYLLGTSDPSEILTINGEEIVNRSGNGFWGKLISLEVGDNEIVAKQGDKSITINLIRYVPESSTYVPSETIYYDENTSMIVTSDGAKIYPTATMGTLPVGELTKGMKDSIIASNGNWYFMGMGYWIQSKHIDIYFDDKKEDVFLKKVETEITDELETFLFVADNETVVKTDYTSKDKLIYTIYNTSYAPSISAGEDSVFDKIEKTYDAYEKTVTYVFTLKAGEYLHGYSSDVTDDGMLLSIKKRVVLPLTDKPLNGLEIMLDAGHGGDESGAYGPLGSDYAEKDVNLEVALKVQKALEEKGATIIMIREDDDTVSLNEGRIDKFRAEKPDLYLSIHANSMGFSTNMDNCYGVVVLYGNEMSKDLASTIYTDYKINLNRRYSGSWQANLAVTNTFWAPAVLVELGFMSNPIEFEWLTNPDNQQSIANSISESIERYYVEK